MIHNKDVGCCAEPTEPYVPPTLREEVQCRISRMGCDIAKQTKILEFLDSYPQAAEFMNKNGMNIYIR